MARPPRGRWYHRRTSHSVADQPVTVQVRPTWGVLGLWGPHRTYRSRPAAADSWPSNRLIVSRLTAPGGHAESYVLGSRNESFRDSLPDQWSSRAFQIRGNGRLFHEK